ncbi:hypothetical protein CF394_02795 [Tetzosporium hominis]|uniref:LysM domain-containing protein n=1 Tax=Tetzosporium hominis TaxID=2020506 RepID=A0A264W736_9BACL|nr:LysM peptidoglycan-binding domain-containing protein [Tetzosporium hominis]OZS79365.1 hypothetical protein CF394_02795 [Tetzosporium hominis]
MANNDYQKKLEEHRKPIEEPETLSRRSRHVKKTKKKSSGKPRNWFLPTLFTIGIVLPVILFVYAYFFYDPQANERPDNQQVVQLDVKPVTPVEQEEEESEEEPADEQVEPTETQDQPEENQSEEEPVVEEEEEEQPAEEPVQPERTHTVQSNETLYRIAMNYYNDPTAVDRIKQANNLTSNEISVGQVLVLP